MYLCESDIHRILCKEGEKKVYCTERLERENTLVYSFLILVLISHTGSYNRESY